MRIVMLSVERVDIGTEGMNYRLRIDRLATLVWDMNADPACRARSNDRGQIGDGFHAAGNASW